jgi:diacylglycerol kinase (ATP)
MASAIYFEISTTEWMAQIIMIGLVMSVEGVNTAVEYIADFVHPEHHKKIGLIKDVAAGAVFIAAITAICIAALIYGPKLL